MRRRHLLRGRGIALFATAALVLAACPEEEADEPGVEETPETESIEDIRDAAANTLDMGTATTTISLGADDGAGQDDPANGAEDDADDPAENDAGDTGDDDTDGELSLQTEEDFDQDQRRITTEAGATGEAGETDAETGDFELMVDGWEVYVPLDDDATATTDDGDDENGADDNAGDDAADGNGLDDDAADDNGADDDAAADDDADDRQWGVFDLQELIGGEGDEGDNGLGDDGADDGADDNGAADDDADGTQTTVPFDDELRLFPFADSHMVLEVLSEVEGDVTGGAGDDGAANGTGFTVLVNVQDTTEALDDDAATWLEWVAGDRTQLDVEVWVSEDEDEPTIERVDYHVGVEGDPSGLDDEEAPEDDPAADEAEESGTEDDPNGDNAEQDAPADDDGVDGAPAEDDEADDTEGTDDADDTETTPEGPDEGAEDGGADVADEEEGELEGPTTQDEGGLVLSIEYTDLGGEVDIDVPTDAEEVTETELRDALPEVPTPSGADAADAADDTGAGEEPDDDAGTEADAGTDDDEGDTA